MAFVSIEMSLPSNWTPIPRDGKGHEVAFHSVKLERSSFEYQNVVQRFRRTVNSDQTDITSIQRIQNPFLYKEYRLRKHKMERENEGSNERQLFHGTKAANIKKINTHGFDRSFARSAHGKNLK